MNIFEANKKETKTIEEQAQEMKAKGSPLTIEQLISFLEKKEAKKAKQNKKSSNRFEARAKAETFKHEKRNHNDMHLEASKRQLPLLRVTDILLFSFSKLLY